MSDVCEVQQHHDRRREVGSIQPKCHGLEKILMQQLELGKHPRAGLTQSEGVLEVGGTLSAESVAQQQDLEIDSHATS